MNLYSSNIQYDVQVKVFNIMINLDEKNEEVVFKFLLPKTEYPHAHNYWRPLNELKVIEIADNIPENCKSLFFLVNRLSLNFRILNPLIICSFYLHALLLIFRNFGFNNRSTSSWDDVCRISLAFFFHTLHNLLSYFSIIYHIQVILHIILSYCLNTLSVTFFTISPK